MGGWKEGKGDKETSRVIGDVWRAGTVSMQMLGWKRLRSAQNLRGPQSFFEQDLRGVNCKRL